MYILKITKLTNEELMKKACSTTINSESNMTLDKIYKCMHSPIRTQLFYIEMKIPSFVSVHFVRHNIGITHYVKTNRDDRNGENNVNRNTLVKHDMLINAEALINMSRKRLCSKAHKETRIIFEELKEKIKEIDKFLFNYLVPECKFRNNYCTELKSCGKYKC